LQKEKRREGNGAAEILLIADEEKVDTIVSERAGINKGKEFLLGTYLISDSTIQT
jgi:nucleotide-binding universal stress UspA family protein